MTTPIDPMKELIEKPGVFDLPTPEASEGHEAPSSTSTRSLNGALLTEWNDDPEGRQELPMVVWLRGDEPWFSMFDMDADAVMQALGIKRSRLTQISGRDLRVGRVRVNRYIRPVYRSIDIEQYLKWTRATASHQKSSDAIKTAVDELQEQSTRIQSAIESITASFTESIKSDMSAFIEKTVRAGTDPLMVRQQEFQAHIVELVATMSEKIRESSETIKITTERMCHAMNEGARVQSAALEILTLQLNQTSEKVAVMEERLAVWDNFLVENLKSIRADLDQLKQPIGFKKSSQRKIKKTTLKNTWSAKAKLSTRAVPAKRKIK